MSAKPKKEETVTIKSVRNTRAAIVIEWTEGSDDCSRTFHDNPLKSFLNALDGLTEHVITLGEFPAGYAKGIEATGITLREKGDNVLAMITAKKKLKRNGRVFNIATPILAMYEGGEDEKGADHMTEVEAAAVEKMIKEAKKYLAGERAQGQIEFVSPEPPKKAGDNTEQFPAMTEPKEQ